ncbi:MAG: helix-turn-helix domain-containing protein [Isosphaeraceae bacterium]
MTDFTHVPSLAGAKNRTSLDSAPDGERLGAALANIDARLAAIDALLGSVLGTLSGRCKPHYTVEEVAELTSRSPYTVRRWVAEGRITATRLAEGGPRGRLLIARAELDRLVENGRGAAVPGTALTTGGAPK